MFEAGPAHDFRRIPNILPCLHIHIVVTLVFGGACNKFKTWILGVAG